MKISGSVLLESPLCKPDEAAGSALPAAGRSVAEQVEKERRKLHRKSRFTVSKARLRLTLIPVLAIRGRFSSTANICFFVPIETSSGEVHLIIRSIKEYFSMSGGKIAFLLE